MSTTKGRNKRRPHPAAREDIRSAIVLPEWAWWLVLAILGAPIYLAKVATSDAWWHVTLGRILFEKRAAPNFSELYFTPVRAAVFDLRWEGAGDLLMYGAYAVGGAVGLQLLSITCLATACVLLRSLYSGKWNGWILLLLLGVVFATHQLQLPRNAVFSLPLTALVFWLFKQWQERTEARWLWLYIPLLALWGGLHGSYLLGIVLVTLLLLGDLAEAAWEQSPNLWRRAVRAACIVLSVCAVNMVGNPATNNLLKKPVQVFFKPKVSQAKHSARPRAGAPPQVPVAASAPIPPPKPSLKVWLNSTIWPAKTQGVRSGDFDSPFDRLTYRPVIASFALVVLALGLAPFWRPKGWAWWIVFAATSFLGLCYLRMTGYASLGAAALLLRCGSRSSFLEPLNRKPGWILVPAGVFGLVLLIAAGCGRVSSVVGHNLHVPGFGAIPTFDTRACQWVLEKHASLPVFTTIVTGSYAPTLWRARKRVFIDGFFSPHAKSVWDDYARLRQASDLSILNQKYGIQIALIEHSRHDWNRLFVASPDWQPAAIGLGCMVYIHRSVGTLDQPEILFSEKEALSLLPAFREGLAYDYYGSVLSLFRNHRDAAAENLVKASPNLFRNLREVLDPSDRWLPEELDRGLTETIVSVEKAN